MALKIQLENEKKKKKDMKRVTFHPRGYRDVK